MVKQEVKTPNKRKSLANDASTKKVKLENGKNATPQKPFTPKKQGQPAIKTENVSPKKESQTPKPNQQGSAKKFNKKNKRAIADGDSEAPKNVTPFAGTKQLNKQKPEKKEGQPKGENNNKSEQKKKRRNQFSKLVITVKEKQGTKDAEILKNLNEKINAITSRPELTKTAKRKLALLQKLKVICEEGTAAAATQSKAKLAATKAVKGTTEKPAPKQAAQVKKGKQAAPAVKQAKKVPVKQEEEDDDEDDDDEEDSDENGANESEDDDEEGSDEEVEGEADDDEEEEEDSDDDEAEDDDDDDDDSEEEAPAPKENQPTKVASSDKKSPQKPDNKSNPKDNDKKSVKLDDLQKSQLVKKGQTRFVLFVGNIPFDTTKQDLFSHFSKAGEIVHVRLPNDKKSNKPRGFGYIEVKDEVTYQKCLSMHHTQLKGRRINVLYTQGGKKKGEDKKKEIKAKNMKLHALRKDGKLAGSVKQSQKRSFRRKKGQGKPDNDS